MVEGGASSSHVAVALSAIRTAFDKMCLRQITLGLAIPRKPSRLPVVLSSTKAAGPYKSGNNNDLYETGRTETVGNSQPAGSDACRITSGLGFDGVAAVRIVECCYRRVACGAARPD